MKNPEYFQGFATGSVGDDERCIAYYPLAGSANAPRSAHAGLIAEMDSGCPDPAGHLPGGSRVVFGDVLECLVQIIQRYT